MLCSPFLRKRKYEHPSRLSDFSADISKTNRISIDILRTKQQLSKMSTTPFMQRLNDYLEYFLLRTYQCSTFLTDANEAFQINKVEKKKQVCTTYTSKVVYDRKQKFDFRPKPPKPKLSVKNAEFRSKLSAETRLLKTVVKLQKTYIHLWNTENTFESINAQQYFSVFKGFSTFLQFKKIF